jgi:hypothetical protein
MDGGGFSRWLPAGEGRIAVVATAAVLVLVVGTAMVAVTTSWSPVSDWALLELQVRAVGGAHTPLVGVYSRFGWNHPGPWPLWLLAVPYRLGGSSAAGLLVGAVVVKGAAVVGVARVAWRRGGLPLTLVTLVAVALLLHSLGVGVLMDPWNPWLAAPAFAWFVFLAWDLACGHRWSAAVALGVGSFAVQAHLGVGLPIVVLGLVAVLVLRLGPGWNVEASSGPSWSRVGLASLVVAVVLWAPTVIQQATDEPGNVRQVATFFLGDGDRDARDFFGSPAEPLGVDEGLAVLARETVGWAPWVGGPEPRTILGSVGGRSPLTLVVPVALVVATALVGRRLRRADLVAAAAIGAAALLAAALALTRVLGQPFDYLVRWTWPIALFLHVVAAWAAVEAVRAHRGATAGPSVRSAPGRVAWAAVIGLFVVSATALASGIDDRGPEDGQAEVVAELVPPALAWVEEHGDGPVLVRSDGGLATIPPAIVLALDRAHADVVVDDSLAAFLPDYRHRDVQPTTTLVVAGPSAAERLAATRGAVRLADDPGEPGSDELPPLTLFALTA